MFFFGSTMFVGAKLLWKSWAPPKTKLFMYLAINRRTWTAERRHRHGLQDDDECTLCSQEPETIEHLLLHCPVAREVWWTALNFIQMPQRFGIDDLNICDTWNRLRVRLPKQQRKGMDSLFILVSWQIWKQRNDKVFRGETASAQRISQKIKDEAKVWIAAGASGLGSLVPRE